MKVEIVAVNSEHIADLCQDLRERERRAFDVFGEDAEQELAIEVLRSAVSFAGLVDGKCVALWGATAATPLDDKARLWLVCGRRSIVTPTAFLRHSRCAVQGLEQRFRLLYGYVMEDFDLSIRWLMWLGFSLDPPVKGVRLFFKER